MQVLKQFSLPLKGLKIGLHDYAFNIDESFFSCFEECPINESAILAKLQLEKKSDHLVFNLDLGGTITTDCDRCTDEIDYPLSSDFQILIKYDEDEREEEEVVYINPEAAEYDCSKLVYEAILLAIPLQKTCDSVDGKQCNPDVLDHLEGTKEDITETSNVFSKAFKNLKLN